MNEEQKIQKKVINKIPLLLSKSSSSLTGADKLSIKNQITNIFGCAGHWVSAEKAPLAL